MMGMRCAPLVSMRGISEPQTPPAATRKRASPFFAIGLGTSSSRMSPGLYMTAACIEFSFECEKGPDCLLLGGCCERGGEGVERNDGVANGRDGKRRRRPPGHRTGSKRCNGDALDCGLARVGEIQVGQSRWEAQRATESRRRFDLRERTPFEHQQAQRSECDLFAMIEAVRLIERRQP